MKEILKVQKGIENILGTEVHYDINAGGASEFYIEDAEFTIGVGDGSEHGAKYSFDIYDDGAVNTLTSGKSNDEKDLIKKVLSATKKYKKQLLIQTDSVSK